MDAMVAAGGEVRSGGASRSYEVGLVQKLPWVTRIGENSDVSSAVSQVADLKRRADLHDEVSRLFTAPAVMPHLLTGSRFVDAVTQAAAAAGDRYLLILTLSRQLEQRIHELAELDAEAETYLDAWK